MSDRPDAVLAAPAKLNLRLLVGPRRADGYHPIESLMVTLDGLADSVSVRPAAVRRVVCAGVAERENLAWIALDALEQEVGRSIPCEVVIDKRIPAQAGLGGGSSDAAATLRGANDVFALGLDEAALERVAARVGSDVPFFVRGGAQWAAGRGELLRPAAAPGFAAVIVKGDRGLATREVYAAFDRLAPPPTADSAPVPTGYADLVRWVRNDLWDAAVACAPSLADDARGLTGAGADAALLCGSGAAVAGLFPTTGDARRAASGLDRVVAVVAAPPHIET